jgi:hypothetical protein
MDSCNDVATASYGSDDTFDSLLSKILETCSPTLGGLDTFNNVLFVNVSTVHHGVLPAS